MEWLVESLAAGTASSTDPIGALATPPVADPAAPMTSWGMIGKATLAGVDGPTSWVRAWTLIPTLATPITKLTRLVPNKNNARGATGRPALRNENTPTTITTTTRPKARYPPN